VTAAAKVPPAEGAGRENLTVPQRTERVEASDLRIKTLGACRFDNPLTARLGPAVFHRVGEAERVLLDDRMSKLARTAGESPALPTFELAGPRDRIFFEPSTLRCVPASTTWCGDWSSS
jgi:hypothetical protein